MKNDNQRYKGVIDYWNDTRRYGFIRFSEPGHENIFFHISALKNREPLQLYDRVEFSTAEFAERPCAILIKKIE